MALGDLSLPQDYLLGTTNTVGGIGLNPVGPGIGLNPANPSDIRLQGAGLNPGGAQSAQIVNQPNINIFQQGKSSPSKDWRVRISLPKGFKGGNPGMQTILNRTNGVVFPYLPTVTVTHNARYQEQTLTHSNYKNYFYEGSDVAAISIAGEFTVQSVDDGQYLLAAIYFFRSATKMFFGTDQNAGNPPPIVYLDGYGDFYFPHVSCVITSFQHSMPDGVDYVEIPQPTGAGTSLLSGATWALAGGQNTVRLPTSSTLTITVQPVYSRNNVYNKFNWNDFASGKLLGNGNGGSDLAGFL